MINKLTASVLLLLFVESCGFFLINHVNCDSEESRLLSYNNNNNNNDNNNEIKHKNSSFLRERRKEKVNLSINRQQNLTDNEQRRKIFEKGNVQIAPLISKTNTNFTSKSHFGPKVMPVKGYTSRSRSKSHHRVGRVGWLSSRPSSSYRSTSSRYSTTNTSTTAEPPSEESSEVKEDSSEPENKSEVEDKEAEEVKSKGAKKSDDKSAANPDYDNYEDEDYEEKQEEANSEEKPLIKASETATTTTTSTATMTTTSTNKPPSIKLSAKEGVKSKGVNEKKGRKEEKLSASKSASQQTTSKKRANETSNPHGSINTDDDDDDEESEQQQQQRERQKNGSLNKEKTKKKKKPLVFIPFIKPKNETICTPEAYLEFPRDLIGDKWRARGLIVIHISVVCYMFYSLALVCERYFMPSLEEFAQRLQLSEDVAGATLMSAGSSAPELFTAILGVFIAKGDVGTGAIVGSAVFNILFVIGICAFVSTTSAQLDWWPVLRDSVFYTFTVLVLILFIYDERVTAFESFSMILLYGIYILLMIHNEKVKDIVTKSLLAHPITAKIVNSAVSMDGPDDVFTSSASSINQKSFFGNDQTNYQTTSMTNSKVVKTTSVEEDSMFMAALLIIVQHKRLFRSQLRFQSAARYIIIKRQHKIQQKSRKPLISKTSEVNYFGPESGLINNSRGQKDKIEAYAANASLSKNKFSIVSKDDYEFWNRPPEEGENYYIWLAKIPVNYVLHYTCPDCAIYPDKYLFTFFISIAWTAFFSYIMVWMVTLIGFTLGIPDSVMGFTFLAAGTSIPDCYSSIHAARNGMANMAVSNSIGSNVFDILIGLSLPWFIQTAIYPGVIATINSRGIIYSVILLFLSLIVTIYLMNKYEWTLKPRLGLALLIAYGLFIVLTCMLEFNLFGHVNPPPC